MRNYELLRMIHEELVQGNGKGSFSNPYLNTVLKLTRLIEEERPEMKEIIQSEKRQNWEIPTDEVKTSKSIVQVASK
jgi:hypothetical protein|tara:strand:- start:370 stop:600 length:231 start_codon:yes stop_codon:yes gene_type:complete